MGANASTAVPLYASGQVLDAARLNLTNCGVPVFSGTATRDAAFGGSGEKVLAEGQLCYLEDSNVVQYYDGASFATVGPATTGALTLISATTIGSAVSSVTVSNAFSATYDNYKIIISGGVSSADNQIKMVLGAGSAGNYVRFIFQAQYSSNTISGSAATGQDDWGGVALGTTNSLTMDMEIQSPYLSKRTHFYSRAAMSTTSGVSQNIFLHSGFLNDATSYTAFTLTSQGVVTMTGGTIRVYGYQNS